MSIDQTFNEFTAGKNLDTNPFYQEDGTLYLRYDGIVIKNNDEGGVSIGFVWQGETPIFLPLPGVRIEQNNVINLQGIEGRQRIDVQVSDASS